MLRNRFSEILFSVLVVAALVFGWAERHEYWLTAEKGWGYALGIIGGSMLLLLLLYPLRKHWKHARNWFSIALWFRLHMVFGILGPVLILFHSNFHLGSLNSQIALFSMLIVSSSGLVGRYAYRKVHRGLYGKQIEFSELQLAFNESKTHFSESELFDQRLKIKLDKIEKHLTEGTASLFKGILCLRHVKKIQLLLQSRSRSYAKTLLSDPERLKEFTQQTKTLRVGISQLREMASYSTFTKLFSLWHIFHLPLFFMMIIAGIVHVFVVHIY